MKLDNKISEYLSQIKAIFPELEISTLSTYSIYNGDAPSSAKIELWNQPLAFKNKFNYTGNFIHYTSIDGLLNIVNSQEVRLYNCRNLNDKLELKYAVGQLGIKMSEEDLELFRQNFFIFSASEYDMVKGNDDFNLWRLYSNSGSGAAIVFEIENMNDNWENIFYGKVQYGLTDSADEFLNFINIHQTFNSVHGLFENTPSIIPAIGLHFKNKIWSIENEVRLIAYCPFNNWDLESITYRAGNPYLGSKMKHTINKSGNEAAYVSLPLNLKKEKEDCTKIIGEEDSANYLRCIPHLKIKRIILGHEIRVHTFVSLQKILEKNFSQLMGYPIEICYSSFKDID